MLFPQSIAPLNLRMSTTWFWRLHLPNGALSLGYFPILVCEGEWRSDGFCLHILAHKI